MRTVCLIILVLFVAVAGRMPAVFAQQEEDFLSGLDDIRNPFMPYVFKEEPEPVVVPVVEPPRVAPPVVPVVKPVVLPPPPVKPVELPPMPPSPAAIKDAAVSLEKELKISGLVWNTDIPQAIINGTVVKVGDEVSGYKVTAIQRDGIEFLRNGLKHLLPVSGSKDAASYGKP